MSEPGGEVGGQESSAHSPALLPGFAFCEEPASFRDASGIVVCIPTGIRSKEKLFAVLVDKLRFPRYFGWNWDALEECLRDLSWLPAARPVAIVHQDLPFGPGGENRQVYLSILQGVLDHWAKDGGRVVQIVWPAALQPIISPSATGRR
jgi:RNAse (barnase) inhibitor barstar